MDRVLLKVSRGLITFFLSSLAALFFVPLTTSGTTSALTMFAAAVIVTLCSQVFYNIVGLGLFVALDARKGGITNPGFFAMTALTLSGFAASVLFLQWTHYLAFGASSAFMFAILGTSLFWVVWSAGVVMNLLPEIRTFYPERG